MTMLLIFIAIVALVSAIGTARQTRRTLVAWQRALESLHAALKAQPPPAPTETTSCPCTCHPLRGYSLGG